jgi:hypothetical protein
LLHKLSIELYIYGGVPGTGHLLTKPDQLLPHFLDISILIRALRETPHQTESLGLDNRDIWSLNGELAMRKRTGPHKTAPVMSFIGKGRMGIRIGQIYSLVLAKLLTQSIVVDMSVIR